MLTTVHRRLSQFKPYGTRSCTVHAARTRVRYFRMRRYLVRYQGELLARLAYALTYAPHSPSGARARAARTRLTMRLLSSPICGPSAMLLMSARPGVITRMAAGLPEWAIRPAKWPDDYDAVCAVRKPTEFVVEDGGAGFMGQRVVIVDPEEAQQRRVQARLASALRDNATVLLVEDPPGGGSVVGTLDCVRQQHTREPGVAPQPRLLLRNLWVAPAVRRQGMARQLMRSAEALAVEEACGQLYLDVRADNAGAIALYVDLGFVDVAPPSWPVPMWVRGALAMTKELASSRVRVS